MLITFRYAQPLLISNLIAYVTEERLGSGQTSSDAIGYIVAATVIYIGLAVSMHLVHEAFSSDFSLDS